MHAPRKIRLTKDWTNPKTGDQHSAGDVIVVPGVALRCENAYDLVGRYTTKLKLTAAEKKASAAPKKAAKTGKKTSTATPDEPPADTDSQ